MSCPPFRLPSDYPIKVYAFRNLPFVFHSNILDKDSRNEIEADAFEKLYYKFSCPEFVYMNTWNCVILNDMTSMLRFMNLGPLF
jgi:hypothetical protein